MSDAPQTSRHGPIRRFLGGLWNAITWTRRALANVIFILLIVVIVLLMTSGESVQPLPESFALTLTPSGLLVDQREAIDPRAALLGGGEQGPAETLVPELVDTIDRAAEDEQVKALVLDLNYLHGGGISKLIEVGRALERFKATGKPLLALSDQYNQDQYYLASHADTIYLHNMGHVLLKGYGSYRNYYREALDKLAVKVNVFRAGQFKDAVEPYTRNSMSDDSRAHNSQWLGELWRYYTSRVETLRGLPTGAVNDLIARIDTALADARGNAARLAEQAELIDRVVSHETLNNELIERFGKDSASGRYQSVDWQRYRQGRPALALPGRDTVGVLVARGTILKGDQPAGTIGSDSMSDRLRQVRQDSDVKALVIRIDSGGGSAFASEVIRAEIEKTRDAGIPVVISMGSVAASGGYWMATAGDEIWALPTSLTGSIGVFGLVPSIDQSLEKLGIHTDGVGTTDIADALRADRPVSDTVGRVYQSRVEGIYQRFLQTVSTARGLDTTQVDRIGQGRVWSGAKAHELGLVDKLGTLEDAIASAASYAELKDYHTRRIERPLSPRERLLRQLQQIGAQVAGQFDSRWPALGALNNRLSEGPLARLWDTDQPGIYAQCLQCPLERL